MRFEIYLAAAEKENKSDKIKVNMLLNCAGSEAIEEYSYFTYGTDESPESFEKICKKFEELCRVARNVIYERLVFNQRSQKEGERIDNFVSDMKRLALACEFGTLKDSLIRDRMVGGVLSDQLRGELLKKPDLTLQSAHDYCRTYEASEAQKIKFSLPTGIVEQSASNIHDIKSSMSQNNRGKMTLFANFVVSGIHFRKVNVQPLSKSAENVKRSVTSRGCVDLQGRAVCIKLKKPQVNTMKMMQLMPDVSASRSKSMINVTISNCQVKVKADTGAKANVIPFSLYRQVTRNTPENPPAIEGMPQMLKIARIPDIITTDPVLKNFQDCFSDKPGRLPNEITLETDESVRPVIHPPRKLPISLLGPVKEKLSEMEQDGIIVKEEEHTPWVSSMLLVDKRREKGKGQPTKEEIRICIDPRDLNTALKRVHHPMVTIEEVVDKLANTVVFTALDACSGFWQLPVDEASSKLLTFNTPWGRYRFCRPPFGVAPAPEIYQREMERLFEGVPVEILVDDFLIHAQDQSEMDEKLSMVLERSREVGLKFNPSKVKLRVDELKRVISSSPVLSYFDNNKQTVLNADASSTGLGAVVMQGGRPVAYGSRTLTNAEKHYANIERELLAITWGVQKFHTYLYGRSVIVQTDHKPLESIFKKPLNDAPPRLQRMLLKLTKYDLNVNYVPGKQQVLYDCLSRAPIHIPETPSNDSDEVQVNLVDKFRLDKDALSKFRSCTNTDETSQVVMNYVLTGWPSDRGQIDELAREYFNYREELSVEDGLLFKSDRIVVPRGMRAEVLDEIHGAHMEQQRPATTGIWFESQNRNRRRKAVEDSGGTTKVIHGTRRQGKSLPQEEKAHHFYSIRPANPAAAKHTGPYWCASEAIDTSTDTCSLGSAKATDACSLGCAYEAASHYQIRKTSAKA
ncbi:uncharacterized protein LOC116617347 [Nematostella vectensis]|uniref:uncharacterized protein LOC116617347 n=1 Tax=Nematostella vectensis TaxID=45351 RepID=UPI00207776B5|nr:uncharacterized protein LOC116617347 [Nematostella vectensis]